MITTIQLEKAIKDKLDKLKIHKRESYNDVIKRNISMKIEEPKLKYGVDTESLLATIEVLSDPECLRDIQEGLKNIQKENYGISLEELEKNLGIENV